MRQDERSSRETRQLDGTHWNDDGELEVLTFDLHGETFALEAVHGAGNPRPSAGNRRSRRQPFVGSVINFRGKVIPLADLRLAFGMEAAEATIDSRIVVIELDLRR